MCPTNWLQYKVPAIAFCRLIALLFERNEVVEKHTDLAKACARSYSVAGTLLQFEDLVAAGIRGILRAHQKYDPEKGIFGSYARPYIRGEISKAIAEGSRGVSHSKGQWRRYRALRKQTNPTQREIAWMHSFANSLHVSPFHEEILTEVSQ